MTIRKYISTTLGTVMILIKGMKQSKLRPKVPHSAPVGLQAFIDTIFTNHSKILNLFHFSKSIFYLTFLLLLSKNGSGDITITDSTYRRNRIGNRLPSISNTTCRISVSGPLDLVDITSPRESQIFQYFLSLLQCPPFAVYVSLTSQQHPKHVRSSLI